MALNFAKRMRYKTGQMANEREVWLIKVSKLQREHLAATFYHLKVPF